MREVSRELLESDRHPIESEDGACVRLPIKSLRPESTPTCVEQLRTAVIVGVVVGFRGSDVVLVNIPGIPEGEIVVARSTLPFSASQIGCEVALAFERGDLAKPIILGCLLRQARNESEETLDIRLDGKRLTLSAETEIVLRCGKASITLTRAGKVLICGDYLLSRSSGVNRIKGGSVQVN